MKNIILLIIFISISIFPQSKRAMTIDDLWAMKRIGTYDVSPDGKTIAFSLTSFTFEANKGNTDIYLINSDGTNLRPVKNSDKNESDPKFSSDGMQIAYTMGSQIYISDLDSKNEKQLTNIYTGASGIKWSNDGKKILFVSSVYPDCTTQECNEKIDKEKESSQVKAIIFDQLMYKHFDGWRGEKRKHLFLLDVESGNFKDLTEGYKEDVPTLALGSSNDYNFSPDGNEVAFTMNPEFSTAVSTNNEIYILSLTDPASRKLISTSKGVDCQPVYSPDGKYLAWTSMKRAGFESDKKDIILYDRISGEMTNLTEEIDRSVEEFIWSPNSLQIYFNAENEIYKSIYKADIESGEVDLFHKENYNSNIKLSQDGSTLFYLKQRSNMPAEIYSLSTDGKNTLKQVSFINKDVLANIETNSVETFWSDGADGTLVQSILVKPPFFDQNKKYPMIFLIHGGPQGSWSDNYHYRWNAQMFASQGYVVVAPNPRGSTGYGQKFTDEISGDWGGKVYVDLMNAYDFAIYNYRFIDKNNTFAAGASYGGYMINWIAGHTDRFNALVSHAGSVNIESKYGTTEELWFPEWEFGGPPWEKREVYEKWSPHRYIQNCKTPILITHGALDFRVTEDQAFQLFTILQRLGVDSMLLYFPDETHFIAKPQNSRLWWETIFSWYKKFSK
ncbi:MAG TPA: S9 family peptidase [Ignavibacteriaceae bacterium]|nr:S9 family peptidase [Ignavibacteriaceae bacterium]